MPKKNQIEKNSRVIFDGRQCTTRVHVIVHQAFIKTKQKRKKHGRYILHKLSLQLLLLLLAVSNNLPSQKR